MYVLHLISWLEILEVKLLCLERFKVKLLWKVACGKGGGKSVSFPLPPIFDSTT